MIFVTDDHRTVRVPKKASKPQGVVPEMLDPMLLAAINKTNNASSPVKPVISRFKTR